MKKTPQVKKRLSYEKDRRNAYGESPHSSRRSIPLRKAFRNRANRHRQALALRQLPVRLDEDLADQIETSVFHYAPKVWRKYPDISLLTVVERKLAGRRRFQETDGRKRQSRRSHSD